MITSLIQLCIFKLFNHLGVPIQAMHTPPLSCPDSVVFWFGMTPFFNFVLYQRTILLFSLQNFIFPVLLQFMLTTLLIGIILTTYIFFSIQFRLVSLMGLNLDGFCYKV
jgi:hypothetical protein